MAFRKKLDQLKEKKQNKKLAAQEKADAEKLMQQLPHVSKVLKTKKQDISAISKEDLAILNNLFMHNQALQEAVTVANLAISFELILKINANGKIANFVQNIKSGLLKTLRGMPNITEDDILTLAQLPNTKYVDSTALVEPTENLKKLAKARELSEPASPKVEEVKKRVRKVKSALYKRVQMVIATRAVNAENEIAAKQLENGSSVVTGSTVKAVARNGNRAALVENVKNDLLTVFSTTEGLTDASKIDLAEMNPQKFLALKELLNPANPQGFVDAQAYVDQLIRLNDENRKVFLNINVPLLRLVFNKELSLNVAVKLQKEIDDPNKPQDSKLAMQQFAENLPATRKYIQAKLQYARARAAKMNNRLHWNGRNKAADILNAANLIERTYLGPNGRITPFDADKVFDMFKENGNPSLTEALSQHRHGFFSRKAKPTKSIQLFNEIEKPAIKK